MKRIGPAIAIGLMLAGCSVGARYYPPAVVSQYPSTALPEPPPPPPPPETASALPLPEPITDYPPTSEPDPTPEHMQPQATVEHATGGVGAGGIRGRHASYVTWRSTNATMAIGRSRRLNLPAEESGYCALAGTVMTIGACKAFEDQPDSVIGTANLSAPTSMYRGQAGTVRFAVVAGEKEYVASDLVDSTDAKTVPVKNVRFGRIMEARLYGEGFAITPAGPVRIDAEETAEALWQWTIVPVRAPRHKLRIEGWVLRRNGEGRLVRARPIHHPDIIVDVPIRWFPEWVHDLMDDSLLWFADGAHWLKALSALVTALAVLWGGFRAFRGGLGRDGAVETAEG